MADLRDNPLTQALVEAEDAANLFPSFKLSATVMPSSTGEDLAATLHVRLTDTSADTEVHARRLLVLALDTSGSMSADAASIEGTTLSRLALAQICVNLSLQSLGPKDDVAIVSFSSRPKLALGITPMTESGKAEAIKVVKALRADGSTDIKGALLMSMDLCQKADAGASTEAMVEAVKQQMTGGSSVTNPTSSTSSFARAIARRAAAFSNGDPDAAAADEENGDPGVPACEPTTPAPGAAEATPANAALAALVAATSPSKAHYSVVRIGLFTVSFLCISFPAPFSSPFHHRSSSSSPSFFPCRTATLSPTSLLTPRQSCSSF
jgi:von Willebrand factor type A domain